MSGCKGRRQCGRGVAGSGYCKVTDSAKAKELDTQMAAALAARAAEDAKLFAAFTGIQGPTNAQKTPTLPIGRNGST
jgi:hypothetical protein